MAEAEGMLDTREGKLQRIIKTVKAYPAETIPDTAFYAICESCGITAGSLTEGELSRIEQEIRS